MKIVHTYINNMNISKDSDSFASKWHLFEEAKHNDVTLVCVSNDNKRKEYIYNNVKVIELPYHLKLTTSTKIPKGFVKELRKIRGDLYHTHHYSFFIPELTLLAGKLNKIPVVITIHNSFNERILEKTYLVFMNLFLPFYKKI